MVNITTLANQLNKDDDYIMWLCEQQHINIETDKSGMWLADADAKKLLQDEIKTPTRYNKRGMECKDIQRILAGKKGIQVIYLGNIIKYLYRRQSVGDLKKASVYLDMWIKEAEEQGNVY